MPNKEVDYRLAKWLLSQLKCQNIITGAEMQAAWDKIAEYYNPPFLGVEVLSGDICEEIFRIAGLWDTAVSTII